MNAAASVTRTLKLRVKREAYPWLNAAAIEVNQVWNFCNDASFKAATRTDIKRKWFSGYDLCSLTSGATEFFEYVGADTIQRVCTEYAVNRKTAKRMKLRWRISCGTRRSCGWVPFKAADIKRKGVGIRFCGKAFRIFESYKLDGVKFRDGDFAQDSLGDWYLCIPVTTQTSIAAPTHDAVGIDLGCKDAAVTSDGDRLASGHYRRLEPKIAQAQRRGHKQQAKHLHRKAARQRSDAIHKFSRLLVDRYQHIFVGDVSSAKLVKTRMAKFVLDAGWCQLKNQLAYKSEHAGRQFQTVNESYTTRVCSGCGALTGPSGLDMLVVRQFTCSECGDTHDRDVNAARNIRTAGLRCRASFSGNEPSPIAVAA